MLRRLLLFAPPSYAVVAALIHYFKLIPSHLLSEEIGRMVFFILLPLTIGLALAVKQCSALVLGKLAESPTAQQKQARFVLECVCIEVGAIFGLLLFLVSGLLAEGFLLMAIAWSGLWLHRPE